MRHVVAPVKDYFLGPTAIGAPDFGGTAIQHADAELVSSQVGNLDLSIGAAPLEAVAEWTEQYRQIWETRFDNLEIY